MDDLYEQLRLANEGDSEAMYRMALYILWDDMTSPVEEELAEQAIGWLTQLSKRGDPRGMVALGAAYYEGRGVPQNYSKAVEWYEKAAEKGHVGAMSNLGYCYYYGRDIPIDYPKAYEMFSRAYEAGELIAGFKAADMLRFGQVGQKEPARAVAIYEDILKKLVQYRLQPDYSPEYDREVFSGAAMRLGICLRWGTGTDKDLLRAESLLRESRSAYQKRVDSGDPFASGNLETATKEWIAVCRELEGMADE